MAAAMIALLINGARREVDAPPDMPLLWVLRDVLGMTGTKFGCGMALCGACTVHLNGDAVRSCVTPISAIGHGSVTTIEAIGATRSGARVQKAWLDLEVVQCGYCQSGQIMSATALLNAVPHPADSDIDAAMVGNICRCGTYFYRPAYHNVLAARLAGDRIVGWKHKISGSSIIARFLPAFFRGGLDPDGLESAQNIPYDIPNVRVEFNREEPPGINTGFWRGVGPNNTVFAIESFVDELARRANKDPIEFRRAHLDRNPRLRAVLDLVKQKSDWDQPLPARCGRSVSVQASFGSFIATVVECEVDAAGEIRLRQVTSVVDAGIAVNPDTIVAQLEGGLIFGLTAALYGEITLHNGRVQQSNFHDYQMLRINQVPPIRVHLIKSSEAPGGIGEAGTTAAVPALRNAIYAATGVALRRMPVDRSLLAQAAGT